MGEAGLLQVAPASSRPGGAENGGRDPQGTARPVSSNANEERPKKEGNWRPKLAVSDPCSGGLSAFLRKKPPGQEAKRKRRTAGGQT